MSNVNFSFGSVLQGSFAARQRRLRLRHGLRRRHPGRDPPRARHRWHGQSALTINNLNLAHQRQHRRDDAGDRRHDHNALQSHGHGLQPGRLGDQRRHQQLPLRHDRIDLTGATGASGDAADLTNIVQFGMPIELSANGQTRGFLPNVGGAPTGQALVDCHERHLAHRLPEWHLGDRQHAAVIADRPARNLHGGQQRQQHRQHEPAEQRRPTGTPTSRLSARSTSTSASPTSFPASPDARRRPRSTRTSSTTT